MKQTRVGETTHGYSRTKLYSTFWGMLNRCYIDTNKAYNLYGGRGIEVCEEWRGFDKFLNFYEWAYSNGYEEGLQLDRIDYDGNYSPENCRWVTPTENSRNQGVRKDNSSGVRGVNKKKNSNKWVARISVDGKRIYLGERSDFEEAVKLRKDAERKYWS